MKSLKQNFALIAIATFFVIGFFFLAMAARLEIGRT